MSFMAEKVLAKRVEPYGKLLDVKIQSGANSASIKLLLKGETEPVALQIDEYRLFEEGADAYLEVKRASASREWLHLLIQDFLVGRRFSIPDQ